MSCQVAKFRVRPGADLRPVAASPLLGCQLEASGCAGPLVECLRSFDLLPADSSFDSLLFELLPVELE